MTEKTIKKHRIVSAERTGFGWVAVEKWDDARGEYKHVSTFRSVTEAEGFIKGQKANE